MRWGERVKGGLRGQDGGLLGDQDRVVSGVMVVQEDQGAWAGSPIRGWMEAWGQDHVSSRKWEPLMLPNGRDMRSWEKVLSPWNDRNWFMTCVFMSSVPGRTMSGPSFAGKSILLPIPNTSGCSPRLVATASVFPVKFSSTPPVVAPALPLPS